MNEGFSLKRYLYKAEEGFLIEALTKYPHNKSAAARYLGIERTTLNMKLKKFRLYEIGEIMGKPFEAKTGLGDGNE